MNKYFDVNGKEIKAGMIIENTSDKSVEKVYEIGEGDLGIMAVSPAYRKNHPDVEDEFYSLSTIGIKEWKIV